MEFRFMAFSIPTFSILGQVSLSIVGHFLIAQDQVITTRTSKWSD